LGAAWNDEARALTTGLDGSIFVCGYANLYGSLDGQTNNGGFDAFLTKYSADGAKAWTKLLGTSGDEMALALTTGLDGSIYISGYTTGSLDGQTNSGFQDAFLTKYSADGTKAWTKLLGSYSNDVAHALTTGLDGSIYVSGYTVNELDGQTNNGGFDAFLTKYSADGAKAWTKLLGTSGEDRAQALTTGLDGSIYVAGLTGGTLDGQTNSGVTDAFLTKYSADGTKAWTKLIGAYRYDYAYALTTGLDGSIYVGGHTGGGSLDGQANSGSADAFLTKYSPDGTKVWTMLLGTSYEDYALALTTGLDGTIYVSGVTYGSLDGQNWSGGGDGFLVKYQETAATPSYSLTASGAYINEGSTATFTLTTTNVASGTSVPYTLSGISAADVSGGSLSGNAVINSSGIATISVTLLNDSLTEGSETLTVSAGGASASTVVSDTSLNSFTPNSKIPAKISLGTIAGKTLNLVNPIQFENGKIYYYLDANGDGKNSYVSGNISTYYLDAISHDYLDTLLNAGADTVDTQANGAKWGVDDERTLKLGSIYIVLPTSSEVKVDFSLGSYFWSGGTRYSTSDSVKVSGGTQQIWPTVGWDSANPFWLATPSVYGHNYFNAGGGTSGSNSIAGVDSFRDNFAVFQVLFDGVNYPSTVSKELNSTMASAETESNNSISNANLMQSGNSLTANLSTVSDVDYFKISTTSPGTLNYTFKKPISFGFFNLELYSSSNTLLATWDTSDGSTFASAINYSTGLKTPGDYYLKIYYDRASYNNSTTYYTAGNYEISYALNANNFQKSTGIKIESESNDIPSNSDLLSENEGTHGQFGSSTDKDYYSFNLYSSGTLDLNLGIVTSFSSASIKYTLLDSNLRILKSETGWPALGINTSIDIIAAGKYYILVEPSNAASSVGSEYSVSYAYVPNTNPITKTPTYSISPSSSSVNEGSIATFTLTTTNVASGLSVPYTLSGISAADVLGGSLSGNTVVNSSGVATISVTLVNDSLTEGTETLTVSAGGATASTVINDSSKASTTPTYSVASTNNSFNEGSTATFILTTTNVSAGTSIWYSFSGISSADVSGGSLSGYATIATNGQATISVLLSNDNLTEGSETLTVTTGATSTTNGVTASTQINDTSMSPSPTYTVRTNWTSTTEGTPIIATLSTSNVSAGTTLFYTLNGVGITTSDFGGLSLSGSSVINSLGQATLNIPLSSDLNTEGDETFVIQYYTDSGRTIPAGSGAFVTIQDTSKGAVTPTYAVTAINSSVNEGFTADFTITTFNVSVGSSISYSLSGVSSSDITGGALTGFATVNSIGNATVSIPIAADTLTEGTETLTISLQGKTASILINDTSKAAAVPTYNLVASSTSVNEGSVASFSLTTTGVSPGTSIAYTISGVSSTDVTGGLSGTATVDINGLATISVPIAADFLTEGTETLTVTAQGKTASAIVNDTSKTTLVASYALSASTNAVSEGSNAVFTLTTTNVAGGTSIPYTISGVSSADITGGALSGTAIVSSSGNATITIPIASDLTTEGTESLTVTAQGISSSVLILDISTTPVVGTPISTVTSIPYGDGKYFYGSSGSDKVTGTSFVDVVKQISTISSNQITKLSDGSWQVQNKITPSNSDNLVNVERIEFSDMSVALDVSGPAGQVAKILGSVFGPSYVSNTEFAGIGFAYLDGGMSYLDLCGLAAGAAALSTPDLLVTTLLRNTTGTEPTALSKSSYLQSISSGASYASVVQQIADSSANAQSIKLTDLANTGLAFKPYVFPPTYSLSATSNSVNEGSTAVFNLTTTNVAVGTEISYTLSGIGPSDLTSGTVTGKVTIGASGTASISVPIAADGSTEGQESLTISTQGATASIVINDSSKSAATPTYSLIAGSSSVDEGASVRIIVSTTNVAPGTSLEYGISGINITTDDLQGGLKGIAVVDSFGMALINLLTLADLTTEGSETMVITMGTSNTQIVINDTSITLVGIPEGGGGDGGGGGGGSGSG
jgi:hypothetical protein